ncbi:argininosuccinate lyase [Actinophytocola oryzae]|uniref:argininosuccinate lyase n=1 Tax=Actinophytocola oryzae TaxID=502181 RepID=A0A4R7V6I3_9PSEU|nr:lyase family protein [Actinophytocola oryzae]TDV43156.1 argininosuccinate lyase [Actinophytocola oryzae]
MTDTVLTGRIAGAPGDVVRTDVLEPQFRYEAEHLLAHYVQVELVLLAEYERMALISPARVREIAGVLAGIPADGLVADGGGNMSDIALAVERRVTERLTVPVWHVDRSRNDLQACTQLMFGRERTLAVLGDLLAAGTAARRLAARYTDDVMPGYTHLQAAQVITPGFFVSALSAHLLRSAERLLATYDGLNRCPLGSGALAGQELAWDRDRMADLLGFAGPEPHALVGVASRAWLLELACECSTFAVGLSRLMTDLMTWAGSEHGLVELPDELAGISSAMPQKKNYPVLERIRGRTAHLTSWYVDVAMAQRNTPFSNTVEVSKEGSAQLAGATATMSSALRLLTEVLDRLEFRTERARDRCTREYLGGFSLANRLTLAAKVPWRVAQVIAGQYVVAALARGHDAATADGELLRVVALRHGHAVTDTDALLREAFHPESELDRRRSAGSAHPAEVTRLLAAQEGRHDALAAEVAARHATLDAARARVHDVVGTDQHEREGGDQ